MRHSTLLFCKSCFILFQLLQSGLSVMVSLGDSVTLDCNIDQSSLRNLWLKQDIGLAPQVLCELLHYETSSPCAVDPLKQHLITERNKDRFSLNISDIRPSDLSTYFCAEVTSSETIVFRNTIFLTTKDFRGEMKKVEVFETAAAAPNWNFQERNVPTTSMERPTDTLILKPISVQLQGVLDFFLETCSRATLQKILIVKLRYGDGSILVLASEPRDLGINDRTMNLVLYQQILEENVLPSIPQ
nr:PREDICTED: uncharacterized protein LOC107079228 isoform X2 [Lepisosteus oculatus]